MAEFIPNSFQLPNVYVDKFMDLLSPAEFKVLVYLARRIFGFNKREDRISLRQIAEGLTNREGIHLDYGTGLSLKGVREALSTLVQYGLVVKLDDHDPLISEAALYGLQLDDQAVDRSGLQTRHQQRAGVQQTKMTRVRLGKKPAPPSPAQSTPPHLHSTPPPSPTQSTPPHLHSTPPLTCIAHPPSPAYHNNISVLNTVGNTEETQIACAGKKAGDPLDYWLNVNRQAEEKKSLDLEKWPVDVRSVIADFCRLWAIAPPPAGKNGVFADWINGARLLEQACAESPVKTVLESLRATPYKWMKEADMQIARPGALVNAARARAGDLARQVQATQPTVLAPEVLAQKELVAERFAGKAAQRARAKVLAEGLLPGETPAALTERAELAAQETYKIEHFVEMHTERTYVDPEELKRSWAWQDEQAAQKELDKNRAFGFV